ncbi:MAG: hypothetical protein ACTHK1_04185 [Actinomycetales bacterium]
MTLSEDYLRAHYEDRLRASCRRRALARHADGRGPASTPDAHTHAVTRLVTRLLLAR